MISLRGVEAHRLRRCTRARPIEVASCTHGACNPALEWDELWLDRQSALAFCLSIIFSENRIPLFRIMP